MTRNPLLLIPALATDPSNIFVAANHYPDPFGDSATNIWISLSHDAGATWMTNLITNAHSDPSVTFDRLGNLFMINLDANGYMHLLLSTNGGVTFSGPLFNPISGDHPRSLPGPDGHPRRDLSGSPIL